MYRPDGWKNTSYDCSVCDTEPEGCPGCGNSAYEAGADAILIALKGIGVYKGMPEVKHYTDIYGKGWLVFIPEE